MVCVGVISVCCGARLFNIGACVGVILLWCVMDGVILVCCGACVYSYMHL